VEQLPRLRRWLKRVKALAPGARLRYLDKDGRRRRMKLVWVSEDQDRFAFVNERGQKVAELTAVQLARQLSRGAQPPTPVDEMSVLRQSMYETLEQAQKTLSFERNRDAVTRLINTDALLKQLRRTLRHAHAHDSEHAFLCLDIDNFKLVNEVFDETSGDEVLAEFARLLGQLNDRRALTARLEEDEFGILFAYRPADEARRLADKIRADIAASSLSIGDEAVSFTVSLGLAPIQRTSESPETIIEQARSALEIAKSQGKDQVVVYDLDQEEIHRYRQERDSSRQRLDEAMDTDRLVLRAQPLVKSAVDGSEEATHRYEVLLALRDDAGELQSPRDFIRSAERFGFITQVDRWVLRETFAWMSSLVDQQKQVPELAINLSGTSITDNAFLDYVLEQISEYGVGTNHICFEITETGAIDNLPKAADFIRTLKNIGCQFSLDDFGTGLASHRYLKELPVDYVKIDGTFISDLHTNRTDYAMTKSINDLAHFLGQKTVAECVETMDIVPALREIGVDYLQGWGVGMPRILSEILDELPDLET
jgi:diguanylate cyclase (GGDEF)-like protein